MTKPVRPEVAELERLLGVSLPENFELQVELYDLAGATTQASQTPAVKLSVKMDNGRLTKRTDSLQTMGLVYV